MHVPDLLSFYGGHKRAMPCCLNVCSVTVLNASQTLLTGTGSLFYGYTMWVFSGLSKSQMLPIVYWQSIFSLLLVSKLDCKLWSWMNSWPTARRCQTCSPSCADWCAALIYCNFAVCNTTFCIGTPKGQQAEQINEKWLHEECNVLRAS